MSRTTVELRLTGVPQDIYMLLLKAKSEEEQRLKRRCNLTDALRLVAKAYESERLNKASIKPLNPEL